MYKRQVKVLYKAKDDVYGVFATDDNTSTTGVLADLKMDSDKKVKLDGTKSVSYTHLDVYKRQVGGKSITTGTDGTASFSLKRGSYVAQVACTGYSAPVSYTHLSFMRCRPETPGITIEMVCSQ